MSVVLGKVDRAVTPLVYNSRLTKRNVRITVKLLKGVETIVAKVEIAYDKNFLLLSQCFRLSSAAHL